MVSFELGKELRKMLFLTEVKTFHLYYFYLQTLRYPHC